MEDLNAREVESKRVVDWRVVGWRRSGGGRCMARHTSPARRAIRTWRGRAPPRARRTRRSAGRVLFRCSGLWFKLRARFRIRVQDQETRNGSGSGFRAHTARFGEGLQRRTLEAGGEGRVCKELRGRKGRPAAIALVVGVFQVDDLGTHRWGSPFLWRGLKRRWCWDGRPRRCVSFGWRCLRGTHPRGLGRCVWACTLELALLAVATERRQPRVSLHHGACNPTI